MSAFTIRASKPKDVAAIHSIHKAAFESETEANLVRSLFEDGDVVLSLVAECGEQIVGSVIYSRLLIDGENKRANALAPISVLPERQSQGIGGALIGQAHAHLKAAGESLVFVLGDPAYYRRFGFSTESASAFRTPYDGPYQMTLALDEDAAKSGIVTYPKAFAGLA